MRSSSLPQSIEGLSVHLIARKISPLNIPRNVTIDGETILLFPITVSHGSGEIKVALDLPEVPRNPPNHLLRPYSQVSVGAKAMGSNLRGGTTEIINLKDVAVGTSESRSGRHSNQEYTTKQFTWLETVATFTGESLGADPWKDVVEKEQN